MREFVVNENEETSHSHLLLECSGYKFIFMFSFLSSECEEILLRANPKERYNSLSAYGQSKFANVLHANELARYLKEEGTIITANSLNPGAIATNLFRYHSLIDGFVGLIGRYAMKSIQQGAATTCYVALHPQVKGLSGCYFVDCNLAETSSQAGDQELARKLWEYSSNLIKTLYYHS
ncbi:short-chain dehydrogenase TIC 32, chloroplastic-like [Trifolium pratense]|uniref:short-chain dehydrogenase TIC 32, chloroplastic-like n=1 Tax=Trifolium pratense TaxID=57577 RepID=UPI001E69546B|nr:short-chain dehydrogenase TIC 32, chloroplastic-like [Trifolium pratense]